MAFISPVKALGCSQTASLHLLIGFVSVVVLGCQLKDGSLHRFVVGRPCYLPSTEYTEFELFLLLGQALESLISWVNSVVGKLAYFTIIYALFLALTETVFEYAMCRQCGCRVYLE